MPAGLRHLDGWFALAGLFDAAMARFGPFETAPHLAVAVSGGPDSTALALLAHHWAARRGGAVTALIVDHGLRAGSSAEATLVYERLREWGLPARVLEWCGLKPAKGIQAAARTARYGLMSDWCRDHGVLHLLTGHHAGDQAETVAMRAVRQSGLDGLAGMSAVVEWQHCRLLRPLLRAGKRDIQAALSAAGIPWVEDPSNTDLRFERARLREAGFGSAKVLPNRTDRAAAVRQRRERLVQQALGRSLHVHPLGFCVLDLSDWDSDITGLCIVHAVAWIGGHTYRRSERAAHQLYDRVVGLAPGRGATFGGCTIRRRRDSVVITREVQRLPALMPFGPGSGQLWDGRFWVEMHGYRDFHGQFLIGPVGSADWNSVRADFASHWVEGVPKSVLASLPALWVQGNLVSIPSLSYQTILEPQFSAVFRPRRTALPAPFAVA